MTPEHASFLGLLAARAAQRCPGPCDHAVDFEAGFVEVGCTRCAARLRLPLRPHPDPNMRDVRRSHVMATILAAAWDRWRERHTSEGWRGYGFDHVPVEPIAEVDSGACNVRAA